MGLNYELRDLEMRYETCESDMKKLFQMLSCENMHDVLTYKKLIVGCSISRQHAVPYFEIS
jgi:hypothetical protein